LKSNGSTASAIRSNIAGSDFANPDETRFCQGRHRLVNIFPPVFAGRFHFVRRGRVGFHPMDKIQPLSKVCAGFQRSPDNRSQSGGTSPHAQANHDHMKSNRNQLTRQYATALHQHLHQGPSASLQPARELGREAVALGLDTLQLARVHEQALVILELATMKNVFTKRAGLFFLEASLPIEETHGAMEHRKTRLNQIMTTLNRRAHALVASNHRLEQGIVRRKAVEAGLAKRGRHHQKRLQESLAFETRLRQLTHRLLAAQEAERTKTSHELQNQIAQTLLGINLRLLTLKQKSRWNHKGFKNEIASAQRLVISSARFVRQFARELNLHPPSETTMLSRRFGEWGAGLAAAMMSLT
jgi:hypothetical protein